MCAKAGGPQTGRGAEVLAGDLAAHGLTLLLKDAHVPEDGMCAPRAICVPWVRARPEITSPRHNRDAVATCYPANAVSHPQKDG